MGIVFVPLYIQYLGIEAYGLVGIFAVLQAWLSLLNMGMSPTINREMARFTSGFYSLNLIKDLLHSIVMFSVGLSVLAVLLIYFLSPWLANSWLHFEKIPSETVVHSISLMGVVAAVKLIEGVYQGALMGLQKQVICNVISAVMATAKGGGAVLVIAYYSPSIDSFFVWQALISLISVAIFILVTNRYIYLPNYKSTFSVQALFSIRQFAGGILLTTLLSLLLLTVDKILLSRLVSLGEFAYYTLAGTVAGVLHQMAMPITQAVSPKFAALVSAGKPEDVRTLFHRTSQLVSVVVAPVASIMIFFGWDLLYLWTGDRTLADSTSPILAIIAVANALHVFMYAPYSVQLAHGWTGLANKINAIAVLVLIPTLLLTVPQYGVFAAALVWLALTASYVFISNYFFFRRLLPTEQLNWLIDDVLKFFFATMIVTGGAKLISIYLVGQAVGWFLLVIVFVISLVVSALSSLWLRDVMKKNIITPAFKLFNFH